MKFHVFTFILSLELETTSANNKYSTPIFAYLMSSNRNVGGLENPARSLDSREIREQVSGGG